MVFLTIYHERMKVQNLECVCVCVCVCMCVCVWRGTKGLWLFLVEVILSKERIQVGSIGK